MQASAPPRGKTRGRDPSWRQGPPRTHHSREGPGTTPEKHRPKRHGKETEGGGHAKGTAGGHTTNRPQPGGAGNHTAEKGGGPRHTAPTPNRAAKPRPERRGQAPKHTTNTPHTRPSMHTTHTPTTATDTSPTNAHHTPKRKRCPHHKRNTHKPKQQEPSNPPRQGGCRAARNTARSQRWTHQARSQEWRTATPSNTRTATPNPRTRHYDTHTSTATNAQTGCHNTLTSGHTRNQRRHRR